MDKKKIFLMFLIVLLIGIVGVIMVSAPWADSKYLYKQNISNVTSSYQDSFLINGSKGVYNKLIWGNVKGVSRPALYYNISPFVAKLYNETGQNAIPFIYDGDYSKNFSASTNCGTSNMVFHFTDNDSSDKTRDVCNTFGVRDTYIDASANRYINTTFLGRAINPRYDETLFNIVNTDYIASTQTYNNNRLSMLVVFYQDPYGTHAKKRNTLASYSRHNGQAGDSGFTFEIDKIAGGKFALGSQLFSASPSDYKWIIGTTNITKGWHLGVFNMYKSGGAGYVELYLDGTLSSNSTFGTFDFRNALNTLGVGFNSLSGTGNKSSNTSISEFRYYNGTMLSKSFITAFYNNTFLNTSNNLGNTRENINGTPTATVPRLTAVNLFNGTTKTLMNGSKRITSLINATNLKIEIEGINGAVQTKTNVSVNVTRRGDATKTNLFFSQNDLVGIFKVNTTNLVNLTRYGNYTIRTKLSNNAGNNITTRNFTIANTMVVNKTMKMLRNSTPTTSSSINLTFNFTDDYTGSVDLNLTIRGRLGKLIQINKTNFIVLNSTQNKSPNRFQSINFTPTISGRYNVSAQFTDGNGSKVIGIYNFSVVNATIVVPPAGGGGASPSFPPAPTPNASQPNASQPNASLPPPIQQQELIFINVTPDHIIPPPLMSINTSTLKWGVRPYSSQFGQIQKYYAPPNVKRMGKFTIFNNDNQVLELERLCSGDYCNSVQFEQGTFKFNLSSLKSKDVAFSFDTTGLKYGDKRNFTNVVVDNEGSQQIFKIEVIISRLGFLFLYWLQIIKALVFAIIFLVIFVTMTAKTKGSLARKYTLALLGAIGVFVLSLMILI